MADLLKKLNGSLNAPLSNQQIDDLLLGYKGPKVTLFTNGNDKCFISCGRCTIEMVPAADGGCLLLLHNSSYSRYRSNGIMVKPKKKVTL